MQEQRQPNEPTGVKNSAVLQSLQEITSLLLLLHDNYLREVNGCKDILSGLYNLIIDLELYSYVSLLDVDYTYKSILQKHKLSEQYDNEYSMMGYELFYDWLRRISQIVYVDSDISGKKSLHMLLVKNIVPYSTNLTQASQSAISQQRSSIQIQLEPSVLTIMSENSDFFIHWFFDMIMDESSMKRSSNMKIWSQIMSYTKYGESFKGYIKTSTLFQSFRKYDLIGSIVDQEQLSLLIIQVSVTNQKSQNDLMNSNNQFISFIQFLHLLQQIPFHPNHKIGFKKSNRNHSNLLIMIGEISNKMLLKVISKFVLAEQLDISASNNFKDINNNNNNLEIDYLSMKSILWMLRQSGLTLIPHIELYWLMNQIEIYAEKVTLNNNFEDDLLPHSQSIIYESLPSPISSKMVSIWRSNNIPYVLYKLLEKSLISTIQNQIDLISNFSSNLKYALFIAHTLPSLLFIQPVILPIQLNLLYSFQGVYGVQSITDTYLSSFLSAIQPRYSPSCYSPIPNYIKLKSNREENNSISSLLLSPVLVFFSINSYSLLEYFTLRSIIPIIISKEKYHNICNDIVFYDSNDNQDNDINIPIGSLLEIIFVIAQESYASWNKIKNNQNIPNFLINLFGFQSSITNNNYKALEPIDILNKLFKYLNMNPIENITNNNNGDDNVKVSAESSLVKNHNNTTTKEYYDENGAFIRNKTAQNSLISPNDTSSMTNNRNKNDKNMNNKTKENIKSKNLTKNLSNLDANVVVIDDHILLNNADNNEKLSNKTEDNNNNNINNNNNNNNNINDHNQQNNDHTVDHDEEEVDPLRDVIILLMHYPIISFRFAPWEVIQLRQLTFDNLSLNNDNNLKTLSSESNLTLFLRKFSIQYKLSSSELSEYFAQIYSPNSNDIIQTNNNVTNGRSPKAAQELLEFYGSCANPKQHILENDDILDLLIEERTLRLLFLNVDLLKWEYCRCYARFKVPNDPFTEGLLIPIASREVLDKRPQDLLIPQQAACKWILSLSPSSTINITTSEMELILYKINSFNGKLNKILNFSTFIIFAIRCFTIDLFRSHSINSLSKNSKKSVKLDEFIDCVRKMLHKFSSNLTYVQQSIRLRILKPLYSNPKQWNSNLLDNNNNNNENNNNNNNNNEEIDCIIQLLINLFTTSTPILSLNNHNSHENHTNSNNVIIGNNYIPPRPPLSYFDAPRFLHICKILGIYHKLDIRFDMAWAAFGIYFNQSNDLSLSIWSDTIINPLPLKATKEALIKLFDILSLLIDSLHKNDHKNDVQNDIIKSEPTTSIILYNRCITSTMSSLIDLRFDSIPNPLIKHGEFPTIEDISRYGGHDAMNSLNQQSSFLRLLYYALIEKSKSTLQLPFINRLSTPNTGSSTVTSFYDDISYFEIPLNVACKTLCCSDLIRRGAIAIQAKRSLHTRVRPTFLSANNNNDNNNNNNNNNPFAGEIVTLNFIEFQELFMRCSFLLWEQSGGAADSSQQPNPDILLNQAITNINATRKNNDNNNNNNNEIKKIIRLYCSTCDDIKSMRKKPIISSINASNINNNTNVNTIINSTKPKKRFWGFDFITPYSQVLKATTTSLITAEIMASYSQSSWNQSQLSIQQLMNLPINPSHKNNNNNNNNNNNPSKVSIPLSSVSNDDSIVSTLTDMSRSSSTIITGNNGVNNSNRSSGLLVPFPNNNDSRRLEQQLLMSQSKATTILHVDEITTNNNNEVELMNRNNRLSSNSFDALNDILALSRLQHSIVDPAVRTSINNGSKSPKKATDTPNMKVLSLKNININDIHDNNEYHISYISSSNSSITSNQLPIVETVSTPNSISSRSLRNSKFTSSFSQSILSPSESKLLKATKEALWPIFATYCSCGDSIIAGELSGPNLFTLLAKLGVLTDRTLLSDIGYLLHQISLHIPCVTVGSFSNNNNNINNNQTVSLIKNHASPSLSFEEFLIFLCVFSQLKYDGVIINPNYNNHNNSKYNFNNNDNNNDHLNNNNNNNNNVPSSSQWLVAWRSHMCVSISFNRLLEEDILPILSKQTLLAFPEDARLRDRLSCIFSYEVLQAIEAIEGSLQIYLQKYRINETVTPKNNSNNNNLSKNYDDDMEVSIIMKALKQINLVPKVISEQDVLGLMRDVMPESTSLKKKKSMDSIHSINHHMNEISNNNNNNNNNNEYLLFSIWEWVLCVVSYQAVEAAINQSSTITESQKIPSLVADVLISISQAMTHHNK
eukprot:gene6579-9045_t